jgi:LCP family protein required for cell wall assembly
VGSSTGSPKESANGELKEHTGNGGYSSRAVPVARVAVAGRWLGRGFVFVLVTLTSATLGATLALVTPFQVIPNSAGQQEVSIGDLFRRGFQYGISRPVNILVMGIDRVPDAPEDSPKIFESRSDTMLLVHLNPGDHTVNLLTIPRDTQVNVPGIGVTKINAANWQGGPNLAAQVVSQTLNDVTVDRYVRLSTDAFRELVDLVGGVEVYVPKRMYYVDETQKLKIDLQPGLQTLDGVQAEGFARFRHDESGDIGRAQRQQALLKALQKRLSSPMMLTRLPQAFSVLQKHIDTNLSIGEMLALMQFGMQLKPSDLKMVLLPGRFSTPDEFEASYWLMDPTGMDRVMKNYFQVSPLDGYGDSGEDVSTSESLRIAIQNASGQPEAGQKMADYLANHGFYNIYIDNEWPEIEPETQVIVQRGDLEAAKILQSVVGKGEVKADSTGSIDSDLTVRVGEDWLSQETAVHP